MPGLKTGLSNPARTPPKQANSMETNEALIGLQSQLLDPACVHLTVLLLVATWSNVATCHAINWMMIYVLYSISTLNNQIK
jgi:hypothetical protein